MAGPGQYSEALCNGSHMIRTSHGPFTNSTHKSELASVECTAVETYVVRVWLPDRPGALGQVASRVGAVRGDVVGIEILETGGGRAVDDLTVQLPEPGLVDLLIAEISEVDGVDVEDVYLVDRPRIDADLDGLEAAATLAESHGDPLVALVHSLHDLLRAEWVVVASLSGAGVIAQVGSPPATPWLVAFVEGARHLATTDGSPDDLAWAIGDRNDVLVAVGRAGQPFRGRERRQVTALARVADAVASAPRIDLHPPVRSVGVDPAA
jgi:hypothetical protein